MNEALSTIAMSLGWVGAILYLIAYYLVSVGKLAANSLRYQALCILSGIMLIAMATSTGAWPSVFSNVIFVGIGMFIVLGPAKRPYLKQLLTRKTRRTTPTVPVADDAQISFTEADRPAMATQQATSIAA